MTATINTGDPPVAIAADPVTGTIYAASSDGTVSVVDGTTNTVTGTISLAAGQDAITVNPQTDTIYAASAATISVISGSTNDVTATIKPGAAGIAADPQTDTIYLTSGSGVDAVNGRTNVIVAGAETRLSDVIQSIGVEVAVNPAAGTIYAVYSAEDEFGPVPHLAVIGSCASHVPISPGTACAKVTAGFQPAEASFATPARGVVLGEASGASSGPALMATSDGGKHWTFLPPPPPDQGIAQQRFPDGATMLFTSLDDGWLYGTWHTSDGGATWQAGPGMPVQGRLVDAMAATATTVYAAVSLPNGSGELLARPVGGTAWTRVPGISLNATGLAVSGPAVWLIGQKQLWAAADGRHWHRYPARCPGAGYQLAGVTASSPSHVAFLCTRPAGSADQTVPKEVLASTDGGRTVHLAGPAPAKGTPQGFASPPGNSDVITIAAGTEFGHTTWLYRSANGGRTWTSLAIHRRLNEAFSSLTYTTRTAGWIALAGQAENFQGMLLHTTNTGRTWHKTNL